MSICTWLTIVGTNVILSGTHSTTHLDYGLKLLFLVNAVLTDAILA
jgi:hypothetical protein